MKILFLALIILLGCQKYSEFEKNAAGWIYITPQDFKIEKAEVVDWKVGPMFKETLSKGIRLYINFPLIKKQNMQELSEKRDINSWLVRINKESGGKKEILGQIYVPLTVPGNTGVRVKQLKKGLVNIYYPAAAVSSRLENLKCPAFDHQLVIKELEVKSKAIPPGRLIISFAGKHFISGKVEEFSYNPSPLNGGTSLKGEYSLELALYNSDKKLKQSGFIEASETVTVGSEERKIIEGCQNFQVPEKQEQKNPVEQFKWNKKKK